MAAPMTAVQIISGCKEWGIKYFEYPDWRTRGRPGTFSNLYGGVVHHTGSNSQTDDYLRFLFVTGRPSEGIPAPLCQFSIDMDGDLHLGALGRANHAGKGSSVTLNHVIKEDYAYKLRNLTPGPDNIDGNAVYYGVECRYDGSRPMTTKMHITLVKFYAMVCTHYGWSAASIIGHNEHTARKNDPGSEQMYLIRRDIDAAIAVGPTWPNLPVEEDTLSGYTPEQLFAISYNANAKYGSDLWAAPSGTGTALIKTVNNIALGLVALSNKVDALAKETLAEDVADDAAFAAAMDEINASLEELKASVPPPPVEEPPKV